MSLLLQVIFTHPVWQVTVHLSVNKQIKAISFLSYTRVNETWESVV